MLIQQLLRRDDGQLAGRRLFVILQRDLSRLESLISRARRHSGSFAAMSAATGFLATHMDPEYSEVQVGFVKCHLTNIVMPLQSDSPRMR
ncbi:hypothetical protein [Ramlibacter sp. WS9]|uniref:hypothetical protein n=1 Tax=Ramlibacter sp. WS9 TaxID=1882741 RepID=UPI0018EEABAA|nr:hypothetical protein [Ramlibacter sp. WS9]